MVFNILFSITNYLEKLLKIFPELKVKFVTLKANANIDMDKYHGKVPQNRANFPIAFIYVTSLHNIHVHMNTHKYIWVFATIDPFD